MRKQQGYIILIAIMLILVMGLLGTTLAYLFSVNSTTSLNFLLADKAFYQAESGLEKAKHLLFTSYLNGTAPRVACANLSGNSYLTNKVLNDGVFTVSIVSGSPTYANSALTAAINSTDRTFTVASVAGFAARGRVFIDREAIDYTALSGNSFTNVARGANGTPAQSHAAGAMVSQYQCTLDAWGGIPNLSAPLAKRELQEGFQLQEGWAVGANNSNNFTLIRWNRPTELNWNDASFVDATNRESLNSISLVSYGEGWAVGNIRNNNFTFLHWNGTAWAVNAVSGACTGQHLLSVSTVSSQEAWAVGISYKPGCTGGGAARFSILKWNGTAWTLLTPSSSPSIPADAGSNQDLNAVHVIDTTGSGTGNVGFAVGNSGQIIQFNGSQWSKISSPTNQALYGVFVVSANEAWITGKAGVILKWNGTSWASVTSPTNLNLNSVFMIDTDGDGLANAGWAVGASGVAAYYNGSTWTLQSPGGNTLYGVAAYTANDAWAVGLLGRIVHWDGTSWTDLTPVVSTQLNAIAIVAPRRNPSSGWREVF